MASWKAPSVWLGIAALATYLAPHDGTVAAEAAMLAGIPGSIAASKLEKLWDSLADYFKKSDADADRVLDSAAAGFRQAQLAALDTLFAGWREMGRASAEHAALGEYARRAQDWVREEKKTRLAGAADRAVMQDAFAAALAERAGGAAAIEPRQAAENAMLAALDAAGYAVPEAGHGFFPGRGRLVRPLRH